MDIVKLFNLDNITTVCIGVFILLLTRWYFQYKKTYSFWSSRGVNGPTPIPVFGNYHLYMTHTIPHIDYNLGIKYGRLYGVYEGTTPVLMIWDPRIVEKIFVSEHNNFKLQMGAPSNDPLIRNQIFFLEGEELKRVRGIITSSLTGSKLKQYFEQLKFDDFNKFLEMNVNKEINFSPMFDLHMLNVVSRHFYGLDLDLFNNPNHGLVHSTGFGFNARRLFLMRTFPSLVGFFNRKMKKTYDYLVSFISYAVEQRIEQLKSVDGKVRKDLLQSLADANLSDVQLKANSIAMIKAGFGTTQSTLCWLSYEIAKNSEIQRKVQEEVDAVFEDVTAEGRSLNYEDLSRLPFLESCFTEVLRLHPVDFRTFRRSTASTKIPFTDIEIPLNTLIKVPLHSLHSDPDLYEDPFTFKPERWLDNPYDKNKNCTFMAFGAGPRMCPGNIFAALNSKLVMMHILHKYTIKLSSRTNMDEKIGGFATVPENVWIKLNSRN